MTVDGLSGSFLVGSLCLGLGVCAWVGTILLAVLLPGGHPPLVAYVAAPVVLASIALGGIGLLATGIGIRNRAGSRRLSRVLLAGNGLVFGIATVAAVISLLPAL